MLVNLHTLLHVPVLTESGAKLGRVYDINFDIDNQCIKSYKVRANILAQHYLIKPVQVISITLEKIVVQDAILKNKIESKIDTEPKQPLMPEVAMSEDK